MKKLFTTIAMAALCSGAIAGPAASPAANAASTAAGAPATKASAAAQAGYAQQLTGTWIATSAENGALDGSLTFNSDGTMELRPTGFPNVKGTWKLNKKKNRELNLELPSVGTTWMNFDVDASTLVLTYDNGNRQAFARTADAPASSASAKPENLHITPMAPKK